MATINPNNYKRPGIFFEEFNESAVAQTPAQDAIINFVPGFSRKGVAFNKPVLIRNTQDREAVYGQIDRFLEKKGSFFHRTIDVSLQTGPIWALSLLKTTDEDTLDFISLSLSPKYDNAAITSHKYSSFFNTSSFWERDREGFITLANDSNRILHFTNMSDKKITVFVFKSSLEGFDVTAETWYGSADKVPSYIYKTDYISDYMVRVIVVAGDFSDYKTLSNDSRWGKYFNASGLRTEKVDLFLNDKAVNKLGDWDVSLIPYFRDRNNRNIFIESVINIYTDITGLYCAFDTDAFETDLPNGLVDLVGNTLVNNEKKYVDFLSYDDTIVETETYANVLLDRLGNVAGIGTLSTSRTTANTNGITSGLLIASTTLTGATPTITVTATSGYVIIGGEKIAVSTTATPLTAVARSTNSGDSNYRIDTLYVDSTGAINLIEGTVHETTSGAVTVSGSGAVGSTNYPNNAIVLGYVLRESPEGAGSYVNTYFPVAIDDTAYVPLTIGTGGSNDIIVNSSANNILDITFKSTAGVVKSSYEAYRRKQLFSDIVAKKSMTTSVIIDTTGHKISFADVTWTDNSTATNADFNIRIVAATGTNIRGDAAAGTGFAIYYVDDEFTMATDSLSTTSAIATNTAGVVAKYSQFYKDFYNGKINSGNYFYERLGNVGVRFLSNDDGFDYIIIKTSDISGELTSIQSGSQLWIVGHSVNNGLFNVTANGVTSLLNAESVQQLSSETAFKVSQDVTTVSTYETIDIYDYTLKHYLKMYTINDVLNVVFMDSIALENAYPLTTIDNNTQILVYSDNDAYVQTVEIETPDGYTIGDNKVLIDATRYPEVVLGNYLEAYVDDNLLQVGEVPKRLTRIISKKAWSGNTDTINFAEIITDAKIKLTNFGTTDDPDYQVNRYTYVEDYVTTYKAIVLNPFKIRTTSIPDGTEDRQTDILKVADVNTALYTAITNKNKFSFRYLVDSFGLGLTEFSKQELVNLCGARKNCIGFINMPSIKMFRTSNNPSFTNTDGSLNFDYVKQGGNTAGNPSFLYSFADGDGKSCVGYFTPYVIVNDNGRPLEFPPASYVMNTYMRKNNSRVAGVYAWTIAAGSENGTILGIADLEYDFNDSPDVEKLNEMGANPIQFQNGQFVIVTENTIDIEPKSSLSFLHSREVLIELENEIYQMLLPYQWKFNTAPIRAEIKRKADDICQKYVDRSAIYAFLNKIDETNNTPEIIDNQMGLLETWLEIVKGMGVIVNSITVVGTNVLKSSGFAAQ